MLIDPQTVENLLRNVQRIADHKMAEARAINRYAALDFSPFRFIDSGEVQTTHLLAFFLDPKGSHGQGDIFQQALLTWLRAQSPFLPFGTYRVLAEKRHDSTRQIDLLLIAPNDASAICIENKLYAADQLNQLHDYNAYLEQRFAGNSLLIYLTPDERPPTEASISKVERESLRKAGRYLNVTYRSDL